MMAVLANYAILAEWSHHPSWPSIAAHRPTDDRDAGQRLDAFDSSSSHDLPLKQQIKVHLMRLLDFCSSAPMHPDDVDPMNIIHE
jgi:hypothetical protein